MRRAPVVVALVLLALAGSGGTAWASTETLAVTVDDGGLLISVDQTPYALPDARFAGTWYATAGTLPALTVVDTRAGDPGWTVSGQISSFTNSTGAVLGNPMSWTPLVVDHSPVQVLTTGRAIIGLDGSRLLAAADPDAGRGTARLTADFRLLLPSPGTYTATLTLTVI